MMKSCSYLIFYCFLLAHSIGVRAGDCITIPKEIITVKYNEEDDKNYMVEIHVPEKYLIYKFESISVRYENKKEIMLMAPLSTKKEENGNLLATLFVKFGSLPVSIHTYYIGACAAPVVIELNPKK